MSELKRLTAEEQVHAHIEQLTDRITALEMEIVRLREVLEWYGNPGCYLFGRPVEADGLADNGARARATLDSKENSIGSL